MSWRAYHSIKKGHGFTQRKERVPELFKYHSICPDLCPKHIVPTSAPPPHPPSLCGLAAYRQPLACGMIALLIWSFQGNYPDINPNTLASMMSTQHGTGSGSIFTWMTNRHRRLQWGLGSTSPLLTPPLGLSATLYSCLSLTHLALQLKGT